MTRVCVFGDSITWGAWDFERGGWVSRLRYYFDNEKFDTFKFYNCGIDGDKVGDVLKRFDVEVEAREAEVVILAIGINDSPHESYEGTGLDEFKNRFEELIRKSLAVTKCVIVVGLTNVDMDDKVFTDDSIKQYDDIVRAVATQNDLPFVDVFGLMDETDLKFDGLHPEADGHQKIADKVRDTLLQQKSA